MYRDESRRSAVAYGTILSADLRRRLASGYGGVHLDEDLRVYEPLTSTVLVVGRMSAKNSPPHGSRSRGVQPRRGRDRHEALAESRGRRW